MQSSKHYCGWLDTDTVVSYFFKKNNTILIKDWQLSSVMVTKGMNILLFLLFLNHTEKHCNLFVCVCDIHCGLGVVLYQSISWREQLIFFCLSPKGPPNFTSSRSPGSSGRWEITQQSLMRAAKRQRHLQFHDWNTRVSWVLHNLTFFLLLSKHSVETPQHSGKKIQTHTCTWSRLSGKS